jgi:hypothetical protein
MADHTPNLPIGLTPDSRYYMPLKEGIDEVNHIFTHKTRSLQKEAESDVKFCVQGVPAVLHERGKKYNKRLLADQELSPDGTGLSAINKAVNSFFGGP